MFEVVEDLVMPRRAFVFHKVMKGNEIHGLAAKIGDHPGGRTPGPRQSRAHSRNIAAVRQLSTG